MLSTSQTLVYFILLTTPLSLLYAHETEVLRGDSERHPQVGGSG
jgi:hypothetical protein